MTTTPCIRCGRPTTDALICHTEALELAQALTAAAGHAEDAANLAERGARLGGPRGGGGDTPLPDLTRARRLSHAFNAITGWALTAINATGYRPRWKPLSGPLCPPTGERCPHPSCNAIRHHTAPTAAALHAAWLAQPRQITWLRQHPDAGEAFTALHDACTQLARLVDVPPDKDLVGMCDCGKVLYAERDRGVVQCPQPTCKLKWDVAESRGILRQALRDKLVTAADAGRLAAHWDERTSTQIRKLVNKWAERGRVVAHGELGDEPAYRFGEVLDRLAESPPRRAAAAA